MIRLLIADDQHLVRGALRALLEIERDLVVIAESDNAANVAPLCAEHDIDVALIDLEMPGNGFNALTHCIEANTRALVLTTFARPGYLRRAIDEGASGFVSKDLPPEQLAEAIRRVHAGLRVIDPSLDKAYNHEFFNPLTSREIELTRLCLEGLSTREISQRLSLSWGTVRNHLSRVISKTQADNRFDAARIANERGWI